MLIAVAGRFSDDERGRWMDALRAALPQAQWCDVQDPPAREAEFAVVANPPPGSLQGLPRLRFVQSLWAGVDRLLADPTVPSHLPIARMVDPAMNRAMAETALWATLSLHRGFPAYARQQAGCHWRQLPQRRADEVSVAVLGTGQMGAAVARTLAGQGYVVTGWRRGADGSKTPSPLSAAVDIVHVPIVTGPAALPTLLSSSDVVINLLPLTPDTRGLLNAARFAQMRRGASLINLARGAHVVDEDLLAALDSGQVGHAVLDVFNLEPLPADHPYWTHPCVTVLPHVAAQTDPRSAAQVVADNLLRVQRGEVPLHLVRRDRGY